MKIKQDRTATLKDISVEFTGLKSDSVGKVNNRNHEREGIVSGE